MIPVAISSSVRRLLGPLLSCLSSWALAQPDGLPSYIFPEIATSYLVQIDGVAEQNQLQATARVSPAATHQSGSRLRLKAGDQFSAEALLAATLIDSAHDARHALADFGAGSEARSVQRKSQRAKQLGMSGTDFVSASGHDAVNHYPSTRGHALLANELLMHPIIIELTGLCATRIDTVDGARSYMFHTTNTLVARYPGTLGLKTGFTQNARRRMVAYAERDGEKVLSVMLHGKDRWRDGVDALDLAFDHGSHPS